MRAHSLFAVVISIGLVSAPSACAAEDANPCSSAHFVEHLEQIGFASNALKLLDGSENPKLRRLLEWRLGAAAEDAKAQLDRGVTVEAVGLPSFSRGLREAGAYASSHQLSGTVISNLTALDAWASKQPGGPSSLPR